MNTQIDELHSGNMDAPRKAEAFKQKTASSGRRCHTFKGFVYPERVELYTYIVRIYGENLSRTAID